MPLAVIVLVPIAVIVGLVWVIAAVLLQLLVWGVWYPRGRYGLIVYSNSPVWQDYFEQHVLPHVRSRAAVLNWSERTRWTSSLAVTLFRFFAGSRDFNPIAMVFKPFRWVESFRFYRPFKDYKHGRPEEVEVLRDELLRSLGALPPRPGTHRFR